MTIVAGIDEAGLGPLLGPLLVSATAFALPGPQAEVSLWKQLAPAVRRKPSKKSPALAIADSKKLYSGLKDAQGLALLERGVLSMLAAAGKPAASLEQLLAAVSPGAHGAAQTYPWYANQTLDLPHALSATNVALCANELAARMEKIALRPVLLRSEVVFEGEFNRLIAATDNKSSMLLDVTCRLILRLWQAAGGEDLIISVDRQGGRMHYLPALQRMFEGCRFKILDETEQLSAYQITDGTKTAQLRFAVGGEETSLCVALASMLSKYLRELLMTLFNRFWAQYSPALAPTAGYHTDGLRFLGEIGPLVAKLGLDRQALVRCR